MTGWAALEDAAGAMRRHRKITILAEGRSADGVFVEADGLFVVPRD